MPVSDGDGVPAAQIEHVKQRHSANCEFLDMPCKCVRLVMLKKLQDVQVNPSVSPNFTSWLCLELLWPIVWFIPDLCNLLMFIIYKVIVLNKLLLNVKDMTFILKSNLPNVIHATLQMLSFCSLKCEVLLYSLWLKALSCHFSIRSGRDLLTLIWYRWSSG